MKKRLLAKENGYNQYWVEDGDKTHIVTEANKHVDILLDKNAHELNEFSRYSGDMHKVASIDEMTLAKLMIEGKLHDKDYMKKWLNDANNRKFRTSKGKV